MYGASCLAVLVLFLKSLSSVDAADLPPACNITAFVQAFAPVMASAALCQTATNVSFMPPTAPLTDANVALVCAASECKPLIPVISQIPPCSIGPVDMGAFASSVGGACGNGTRTPTTPSPNPSTAPPSWVAPPLGGLVLVGLTLFMAM
ncbi:hypothetical protein H257_09965 [Aphanomyces astaci]|uniref:Elicitin n=1 Tax=Aphanomyces astaci TaxID=112090 RepID=W4G8J1_APHAT|nr:hypothetical protein H257_09965 [Aphanomyces astaci]ETV76017.1 hypothetical protein H257_09965 [Aphanomyces astaci]|eukprot:XP_009834659.1 hypothetical protein H257_09965 [Aphanomyces astaci]